MSLPEAASQSLAVLSVACRQDPSTVRTERRVAELILMGKGGHKLARDRIPELGAVIFRACRQDPSAVRAKRRVKPTGPRCSKEAMSLPEAASQSLTL